MKIDINKVYTTVCGDEVKFHDIIVDDLNDIKLVAFKVKRLVNSSEYNAYARELSLNLTYTVGKDRLKCLENQGYDISFRQRISATASYKTSSGKAVSILEVQANKVLAAVNICNGTWRVKEFDPYGYNVSDGLTLEKVYCS
jgi:hypothetical protein